jgi:MSHA pilin protein MshC
MQCAWFKGLPARGFTGPLSALSCRYSQALKRFRGFTLVEMIAVMVVLGIISAIAIPRMFDRQTFDARGFFDQTKAVIRYAQKAAIAQHRNVFVNTTTLVSARDTICLTYSYVPAAPCGGDFVVNPGTNQPFLITQRAGVNFDAVIHFSFSPLGRPSAAQLIGVVGDGMTRTITVESETGYVH